MDQGAPRYLPGLSLEESARFIGTARGPLGTSLDYLDSLVAHFKVIGIVDEELTALHVRAAQIAANDSKATPP
jgi:cation transport regulator ChaC